MMGEATPEGGNPVAERGVFRCLSHKLLDSLSFAVIETVTKTIATLCLSHNAHKITLQCANFDKGYRRFKRDKKFLEKILKRG